MAKYRQNQSAAAAMFEKRKRDMTAKPTDGEFPFIEPGDENSKFYTKPDVPPIPHPADLLDDLKKEFPDKSIEELVVIADERVAAEVARRKAVSTIPEEPDLPEDPAPM
jgi:Glu-tRNA(Gln) amidotransferase subunit E-like FAD-binding protein